ncbi:hypothetical protein M0802_013810 [Mischocyttarus mexicanus]|nr:hypothetical protein M0802_013810 [Mischocyttarus mexicanus]
MYIDESTHFPLNNTTLTTIDICVNKNVNHVSDLKVLNELNSDHNSITFLIEDLDIATSSKIVYDYQNADRNGFRKVLRKKTIINNKILNVQDLDREIRKLTNNIQYCIKKYIPT